MYLNYYNLKKEPFNITPDPDLLFLSPSHKEALAAVIYGVTQRKGFVVILGQVGVGKTTIIRSFLDKAKTRQLKVIYLFNANLSFKALLKTIYHNLERVPESDDVFGMVNQLHGILIESYKAGINVVLIVDEAQNMPVDTLKNLHMLSNLETSTEKLIQVVFSGQPEFEDTLSCDMLRQLKQRVVIKVKILPLTTKESFAYIDYRLSRTAEKDADIFTTGALRLIIQKALGIPRVMNTLCDNCLITAFGRQQPKVTAKVAKEIIAGLSEQKPLALKWKFAFGASALVALMAFVALVDNWQLREIRQTAVSAQVPSTPVKHPIVYPEPEPVTAVNPEPPSTETIDPAPFQKKKAGVTRVIKKGDTLARLIAETYGSTDRKLIEMVKQNNPAIVNENIIVEGNRISFPEQNR